MCGYIPLNSLIYNNETFTIISSFPSAKFNSRDAVKKIEVLHNERGELITTNIFPKSWCIYNTNRYVLQFENGIEYTTPNNKIVIERPITDTTKENPISESLEDADMRLYKNLVCRVSDLKGGDLVVLSNGKATSLVKSGKSENKIVDKYFGYYDRHEDRMFFNFDSANSFALEMLVLRLNPIVIPYGSNTWCVRLINKCFIKTLRVSRITKIEGKTVKAIIFSHRNLHPIFVPLDILYIVMEGIFTFDQLKVNTERH